VEIRFQVRGSESLHVAHIARSVEATVSGAWADPSFTGAYLPTTRQVSGDGFEGRWSLPFFGRPYGQVWTTASEVHFDRQKPVPPPFEPQALRLEQASIGQSAAFGVTLLQPITVYRELQRVVRYGMLFIATTFAAVFLFEILTGLRAHVVHYGLIGLAVVLFYALVLALAELLPFGWAYTAGAALSPHRSRFMCGPSPGSNGVA
jgi:inner membrane protein